MPGPYMLDTDILIHLLRGKRPELRAKLNALTGQTVAMSAVTLAELETGAAKSRAPKRAAQALAALTALLPALPFDAAAAKAYGKLLADLEAKGQTIGPMDLLIAAHAVSGGFTLATGNGREFERVQGLGIESWLK